MMRPSLSLCNRQCRHQDPRHLCVCLGQAKQDTMRSSTRALHVRVCAPMCVRVCMCVLVCAGVCLVSARPIKSLGLFEDF